MTRVKSQTSDHSFDSRPCVLMTSSFPLFEVPDEGTFCEKIRYRLHTFKMLATRVFGRGPREWESVRR